MEDEIKRSVDGLVKQFRRIDLARENRDRVSHLRHVLDTVDAIDDAHTRHDSKVDVINVFLKLLNDESKLVVAKAAYVVKEKAKTDGGRNKFSDRTLIKTLVELLKSDDTNIQIQTMCALANICYENEEANIMVQENNGLEHLLPILEDSVNVNNKENESSLRTAATGCLLNLLADQPGLQEMAIKKNVVSTICSILKAEIHNDDRDAVMYSLLILNQLRESGHRVVDARLCKIIVAMLRQPKQYTLGSMSQELILELIENDNDIKLELAKNGYCELLLDAVEDFCIQDSQCAAEASVEKTIQKCIVLVLTEAECANALFGGKVYEKLFAWLDSTYVTLQATATLGMANFATNDKHCQSMVEQGVHLKLLKILRNGADKMAGVRFTQALLCALRNLVIPACNKAIVIGDGLIDVICPMLESPDCSVTFELLGTIRIGITCQRETAIMLGTRNEFVKKVVECCNVELHAGVQGEANRLVATLIIHSRDKEVALTILKHGGVAHLVKMMATSQHVTMQNEALASLIILTAVCLEVAVPSLIGARIGEELSTFIQQIDLKSHPSLKRNAFTLMSHLVKSESDTLVEHLKEFKLVNIYNALEDSMSTSSV